MRSLLRSMAVLCLFSASSSVFSAPLGPKALPAADAAGKYHVCSITINSSHEINAFKKVLGTKKFEYTELTTQEFGPSEASDSTISPDWLKVSCHRNIRCDILVVSGHFGGRFFGSKSKFSLELDDLEVASCDKHCKATIQAPKEVFLFGCNTLAGKGADFRTPEQYRDALIQHDFDPQTAEQMVAFRYSQFGDSFAERMMGVFKNTPRIYGFDSSGPAGANVEDMLTAYLKKAESTGYYSQGHFMSVDASTNQPLKVALRSTSLTQAQGLGEQNYQSAVCYLHDKNRPMYNKYRFIEEALTGPNMLAHLPYINAFLKKTIGRYGREWDDKGFEFFENIAKFNKAKAVMDDMISRDFDAILSMQMNALQFERTMGWITEPAFKKRALGLLLGNEKTKWTLARHDTVRSIIPDGLMISVPLRDLPANKFNDEFFMKIVGVMRTSNAEVLNKLIEISESPQMPAFSRENALRSLIYSTQESIARDYINRLLQDDGIFRVENVGGVSIDTTGLSKDVQDMLMDVASNPSASLRRRITAMFMHRGYDGSMYDHESIRVGLIHEFMTEYSRKGQIKDMTDTEACKKISTVLMSGMTTAIVLSKEERKALGKLGPECPAGYTSGAFSTLRSQETFEDEVFDAMMTVDFRTSSGWISTNLLGASFNDIATDQRKIPKATQAILAAVKAKGAANQSIGALAAVLHTAEGQAALMSMLERDDRKYYVWSAMSLSRLSDANRAKLVERAMKFPLESWSPMSLVVATILTPSLAEHALRPALEAMTEGYAGLSYGDEDNKVLGPKVGSEQFFPHVYRLLHTPNLKNSAREGAISLLTMARPSSPRIVTQLREMKDDQNLSRAVREGAVVALLGIGDSSVGEKDLLALETLYYPKLNNSPYKDRLFELASKALTGPTGYPAASYIINAYDKPNRTELLGKFLDYQLAHHPLKSDFAQAEISTLRSIPLSHELDVFHDKIAALAKFVRRNDFSSPENARLAGFLVKYDATLQAYFAELVRRADWKVIYLALQDMSRYEIYSSEFYEAVIDRLETSTDDEQILRLAGCTNYSRLSLAQIRRIKAIYNRQTEPKLKTAVRYFLPSV